MEVVTTQNKILINNNISTPNYIYNAIDIPNKKDGIIIDGYSIDHSIIIGKYLREVYDLQISFPGYPIIYDIDRVILTDQHPRSSVIWKEQPYPINTLSVETAMKLLKTSNNNTLTETNQLRSKLKLFNNILNKVRDNPKQYGLLLIAINRYLTIAVIEICIDNIVITRVDK